MPAADVYKRQHSRSTTRQRFRCSQHCTARYSPLAFILGSTASITAFAASTEEPEPMRLPTISLVEQPITSISPLFRVSAAAKSSSMAAEALSLIHI